MNLWTMSIGDRRLVERAMKKAPEPEDTVCMCEVFHKDERTRAKEAMEISGIFSFFLKKSVKTGRVRLYARRGGVK